MFANYNQLFSATLDQSLNMVSTKCLQHPESNTVYVCVAANCNTPICIRCEDRHTKEHSLKGTNQKYISFSQYTRLKGNNVTNNLIQNDWRSQLIQKIKIQKKQFINILETLYKNNNQPAFNYNRNQQNKNSYNLQVDTKLFTESLKRSINLILRENFKQLPKINQFEKPKFSQFSINQIVAYSETTPLKIGQNENRSQPNNGLGFINRPFSNDSKSYKPFTADITPLYRPQSANKPFTYNYQFTKPSTSRQINQISNWQNKQQLPSYNNYQNQQQFSYKQQQYQYIPKQNKQSNDTTVSKIADNFWKKDQPDKAFYSSYKGKTNLSQEFLKNPLAYFRNR